jgi:PAS domain S-box-containing protein
MRNPVRDTLGLPVLLAFWLVAASVLFHAALTHHHTQRVFRNGAAVAEAYERRAAAAGVLTLMRDAETGQRGFLLTGQDRYLEPYVRAREDLPATLERLREVPSLGPEEDRLVARMRSATAITMEEFERSLRVRREQGLGAVREQVLADRGRQAMVDLRAASSDIRELETRELERRAEESRVSYRSTLLARLITIVAGLTLVYAAYRLSDRNAWERARHLALRHADLERFRVTLRSIGDAVIVTDAEARVRSMNPVAEALTGWQGGWESLPVTEVFRVQDEAGHAGRDPVGRVLEEGRGVTLQNPSELVKRDGQTLAIDDSAAPIRGGDGNLTGVVLVFRDITERREAERLVRRQQEALEESDRRKDEFLTVLAHELRNPLGALRNAVEVLRLVKAGSAEAAGARDIIERQLRRMTRLVDDLIDVARISSGRMALHRAPSDVGEAVDAAVERTASLFAGKRQRLERRGAPGRLFVDGDAGRLVQVFTNLLNNAARYTAPGGRIELEVARAACEVVVTLRDDGIGIGPDLLPHVFDLFRQGQQASGTAEGGLGIGLTLAHRIVAMHGGTLTAASPGAGSGSTFVVSLPLAELPA